MDKFFQSPPSQGIVLGLLFEVLGDFLHSHSWHGYHNNVSKVGQWVLILGAIMIVVGCFNYARRHGLNKWFAALGVLSLPGVLILVGIVRLKQRRA